MVPTSAFTSCVFPKGGRVEKEGVNEGLEENKCKMKAFLEATKELYAGKKKAVESSMGLKNRQTKLGKEEGMPYNATRPPCSVQRASQKYRKEHESERQSGNDGPAEKDSICS